MGQSVFVGGAWIAIFLIGLAVLALGAMTALLVVRRFSGSEIAVRTGLWSMPYATTAMLALFLGFMASDIWLENRRANDAAGMERLALERLSRLAEMEEAILPDLSRAVTDYRDAVIAQEWGANHNAAPVGAVDAALDAMWRIVLANQEAGAGSGLSGNLVAAVDALEVQREVRLNIGRFHDYELWLVVFVLTYFSCCAFAFSHLDRPAAARSGLMLFVAMMLLVFMFLALFDGPYEGFALQPSILERQP